MGLIFLKEMQQSSNIDVFGNFENQEAAMLT